MFKKIISYLSNEYTFFKIRFFCFFGKEITATLYLYLNFNLFITADRYENIIRVHLSTPLINFVFKIDGLSRYIIRCDETSTWKIGIFNEYFSWCLGRPMHTYCSGDIWNRSINLISLILGNASFYKISVWKLYSSISLPEGDYSIDSEYFDHYKEYSRLPRFVYLKKIRCVDVKIKPGIPYPGKNSEVSYYSDFSFASDDAAMTLSKISSEITKRRLGDLSYYNKSNLKVCENYMYTVHGLSVNLGRIPIKRVGDSWVPLGVSYESVSQSVFKELLHRDRFTADELGFINSFLGRSNSLDFIKDYSFEDIKKDMKSFWDNKYNNDVIQTASAA